MKLLLLKGQIKGLRKGSKLTVVKSTSVESGRATYELAQIKNGKIVKKGQIFSQETYQTISSSPKLLFFTNSDLEVMSASQDEMQVQKIINLDDKNIECLNVYQNGNIYTLIEVLTASVDTSTDDELECLKTKNDEPTTDFIKKEIVFSAMPLVYRQLRKLVEDIKDTSSAVSGYVKHIGEDMTFYYENEPIGTYQCGKDSEYPEGKIKCTYEVRQDQKSGPAKFEVQAELQIENTTKMSDSIKRLVAENFLDEKGAELLQKKFKEYHIPLNMVDVITQQWKHYDDALSSKIPSLNDALFIDDDSERYVLRCCAHILGINGDYPRLRLVGELSVGKDVLIRTLAALFHKPVDIITIFNDTQKEDLFGAKTIESKGEIVYKPEPLIQAMENGTWIVLDEINVADAGLLASLHKVLDTEKAITVAGYKRVVAKKGFGFFASMNPSDSNYNGTKELNPSTQSRMKTIEIKKTVSFVDVLKRKCPYASNDTINRCARVYNKIREMVENEALSQAFLAMRLYEDAIESATWIPIKDALLDIVGNADTNSREDVELVKTAIQTQLGDM